MNDSREVLWATPKINGLRGRWKAREGSFRFLTREDYPLYGFEAIEAELERLEGEYGLGLIDGEVFSLDHPFQTIMSIARGNKNITPEQKDALSFFVFNIQPRDGLFGTTQEMVNRMKQIDWPRFPHLKAVPYMQVQNTDASIIELCQTYMFAGWEGIVLRDPIISWEAGKRNRNLMKFKLFYETDLTVTDIIYGEPGKKWEHSLVALMCEGSINSCWFTCDNGDHYRIPLAHGEEGGADTREIPIRVAASLSKMDDATRALMTAKGRSLIGETAEVRFQAITDHPNDDGFYSLQFPVFLKFKDVVRK